VSRGLAALASSLTSDKARFERGENTAERSYLFRTTKTRPLFRSQCTAARSQSICHHNRIFGCELERRPTIDNHKRQLENNTHRKRRHVKEVLPYGVEINWVINTSTYPHRDTESTKSLSRLLTLDFTIVSPGRFLWSLSEIANCWCHF